MTVKTEIEKESISGKYIIASLVTIVSISIILKLYTTDFSFPLHSDPLAYGLAAISHTNGDFSQSSHRGIGWSVFVSIFYSFINSDNFLVYSNTIKILSLSIASSTIFLVYLLGRKFFSQKYSLVVATLFAFGGEIIHAFAFTLLIGIIVGTYSSIFVASPILLAFGFDVKGYHVKLAAKAKREAEKQKMRDQFESGVM